ncbi:hypothetical protein [Deinococcus multiflagellatus]|uniref:hypothetical protein n=1 Tax=Deinococcus multiflagellatus TaxID=1656887 RepID=UPI001CCA6659|nr:hypothetical protein [Deinococcus multiflagellatus]MBZ9713776.1 hypothetical protein [Deinococcus multiflagellatus]
MSGDPTPCPYCGRRHGLHRDNCATRRSLPALLHASCTGGVTDCSLFDPVRTTVTLPYGDDAQQRVLCGVYRGMPVWDASRHVASALTEHWHHIRVTDVVVRPWWRLWRRTPAKRVIPSQPRGGQP